MREIGLLRNTIQEYDWGSTTAISELLGQAGQPDKPQAELWMGTHPKAPSEVLQDGVWKSLLELVEEHPDDILGKQIARRFHNKLPFLFKVLAAAKPLSIQAHPNSEQARRGFMRENELGIPLKAPNRNYRDDNHKPEIICALTVFWALKGFREVREIIRLLDKIQSPGLAKALTFLRDQPNREGLKGFFRHLMTMEKGKQNQIVEEAVGSAEKLVNGDGVWQWIVKLNLEYPGDIGVISAIFLNLIQLTPGQAMYLPAGELHAYLEGVGIELMANSDNVLRGGLTPKHVDVQELLNILNFAEGEVDILRPKELGSGEAVYETGTSEFVLSTIKVSEGAPFKSSRNRSVEIMICTEGAARVTDLSNGEMTRLPKGGSVIVPAAVKQYNVEGDATLYKAAVPLEEVY